MLVIIGDVGYNRICDSSVNNLASRTRVVMCVVGNIVSRIVVDLKNYESNLISMELIHKQQ